MKNGLFADTGDVVHPLQRQSTISVQAVFNQFVSQRKPPGRSAAIKAHQRENLDFDIASLTLRVTKITGDIVTAPLRSARAAFGCRIVFDRRREVTGNTEEFQPSNNFHGASLSGARVDGVDDLHVGEPVLSRW